MKPYQRLLFFLCLCLGVLSAGSLACAATIPSSSAVPTMVDNDATTRKAYDHFYNLEYDKAIKEFETAQAAHPDDPFATNHLLGAVVFHELYRIGALDTESYAADGFLTKKLAAPLDPATRDRVKQLTDLALSQSQAQLDKNPNDVNALYARSSTRAVNATYVGVATHAWITALRSAVAARHDSERVLELDPNYIDAKVTLGTHLYIVGSLSWPVKVAASVAGLIGNKQKGLDDLRDGTKSPHIEVATDAKIILALFLRREQRYAEALQIVNGLQTQFPRNFLMATEYAFLLNAAGHGQEAIGAYRKVLAGCHNNTLNGCRVEIPAYGLGESLRGQRQYAEAAEAYELAATNSKDPDLKQKAMLSAGQMYDVMQKRNTALEKYKMVIAENSGSNSADLARHYMKQPYKTP